MTRGAPVQVGAKLRLSRGLPRRPRPKASPKRLVVRLQDDVHGHWRRAECCIPNGNLSGTTLSGEATRKAPAQAELRPTFAGLHTRPL